MSTTNYFPSGGEGWDRLHAGPLSCHVDDYAVWLAEAEFSPDDRRAQASLAGIIPEPGLFRNRCLGSRLSLQCRVPNA